MKEAFKKTALGRFLLEQLIEFKVKNRKAGISHEKFQGLRSQFGNDSQGMANFVHGHLRSRTTVDPSLHRIITRLRTDFQLLNFVETGTYEGETALAMSLIFDRVYTCDVKDWERPVDFYFADNLIYETKSSPDFLRSYLPKIRRHSLFFLDAHWGPYWPLRDELEIIFKECENPVVVIDDFNAGNGLCYDAYGDQKLDFDYIGKVIPGNYRFFVNPRSNRNCGMIFIFPPSASYGCPFAERDRYNEEKYGLWDKVRPAAD